MAMMQRIFKGIHTGRILVHVDDPGGELKVGQIVPIDLTLRVHSDSPVVDDPLPAQPSRWKVVEIEPDPSNPRSGQIVSLEFLGAP